MKTDIPLLLTHFARARWHWQHLRGERLSRFQDRRAAQVIAYTQQHSPFYRAHWSGYDVSQWRTLPVVDKQIMMEHFDIFTTRGIRRADALEVALCAERSRDFRPRIADLTVGLSSGTSGHRGLFLVSASEQASWAGVMLARTLHHLPRRHLRVAFFLRSNSNLYEQVGRGPIQFRYFDLMTPLAQAVAALNELQPHIVIGPPSLLGYLAIEQTKDRLRIRPARLISVAEVLEPNEQRLLEHVFAVPVHQIYQCTEGLLGVSCVRGALHVQEDLVALQYEPLPESAGERVTPIITDLWRTTQPIVRYRLNDILQLDPAPCPCGSAFQVIRAVEGRSDDVCFFASLTGETRPFFPDTIRRMILLASPHITDYQVEQERHGQLHIYLAIDPTISFSQVALAVRTSVRVTLAQYKCRPATVTLEEGLPARVPSAKRRRVVNKEHTKNSAATNHTL